MIKIVLAKTILFLLLEAALFRNSSEEKADKFKNLQQKSIFEVFAQLPILFGDEKLLYNFVTLSSSRKQTKYYCVPLAWH